MITNKKMREVSKDAKAAQANVLAAIKSKGDPGASGGGPIADD